MPKDLYLHYLYVIFDELTKTRFVAELRLSNNLAPSKYRALIKYLYLFPKILQRLRKNEADLHPNLS